MIQNVFTSAKALSLAALVVLTLTVGRNATAMAANFGNNWSEFWRNAGWSSLHPVQVGIGGPIVLVNLIGDSGCGAGWFAVFCRCVEQHHVYGWRGEESAAQHSAVPDAGHRLRGDRVFPRHPRHT